MQVYDVYFAVSEDTQFRFITPGLSRGVSGPTNSGALAQKVARVYARPGISKTGKHKYPPGLTSSGFSAKAG
jgi:hypothetical protein